MGHAGLGVTSPPMRFRVFGLRWAGHRTLAGRGCGQPTGQPRNPCAGL